MEYPDTMNQFSDTYVELPEIEGISLLDESSQESDPAYVRSHRDTFERDVSQMRMREGRRDRRGREKGRERGSEEGRSTRKQTKEGFYGTLRSSRNTRGSIDDIVWNPKPRGYRSDDPAYYAQLYPVTRSPSCRCLPLPKARLPEIPCISEVRCASCNGGGDATASAPTPICTHRANEGFHSGAHNVACACKTVCSGSLCKTACDGTCKGHHPPHTPKKKKYLYGIPVEHVILLLLLLMLAASLSVCLAMRLCVQASEKKIAAVATSPT